MKLPRDPEELLPALGAFGVSIALGKLLASKASLTWRAVFGRAVEGAGLCMSAGVILLFYPTAHPIAVLGVGGLLVSIGVGGAVKLVQAWKGGK